MLQRMDGQTNRFLADSYIRWTFQLGILNLTKGLDDMAI